MQIGNEKSKHFFMENITSLQFGMTPIASVYSEQPYFELDFY